MNQTPRELARRFIDITWRRRKLLYVPMLIMVPLSIIVALATPRTFVARTLLLLQETSGNPFTRDRKDNPQPGAGAERSAGLQALLRSDRVLAAALRDILGEETPQDPKVFKQKLRDLEAALTLEVVGDDFLELKLKGDHSNGLGKQLGAVVGRFLEGLMPTSTMTTATQVILDRRNTEVKTAEHDYETFVRGPAGNLLAARDAVLAKRKEIEGKLASLKERIEILDSAIDQAGKLAAPAANATADTKDGAKDNAKAQALAKEVSELTAQRAALVQEATAREQERTGLLPRIADIDKAEKQRRGYEQAVLESRALQQAYARRSANMSKGAAVGILSAPERIRVIDPPEDPIFPLHTRTRLVLAALLASLVLGAGLAFTAELLDDTLRTSDDMETTAGLTIKGLLPRHAALAEMTSPAVGAASSSGQATHLGLSLSSSKNARAVGNFT